MAAAFGLAATACLIVVFIITIRLPRGAEKIVWIPGWPMLLADQWWLRQGGFRSLDRYLLGLVINTAVWAAIGFLALHLRKKWAKPRG